MHLVEQPQGVSRRTCRCGAVLPGGSSPRRLYCDTCKKAKAVERVATWSKANPDRVKANRDAHAEQNRQRAKAWYEGNKERHAAFSRKWREENPEKMRAYYAKWRSNPQNDAKARKWIAAWQKANSEKMHAYYKRWAIENADALRAVGRERARLYARSTFTFNEWVDILETFGHRCAYCLCGDVKLTMDHVIPISRGGEHSAENIVPACQSCNSRKKNRPVFTMAAKM